MNEVLSISVGAGLALAGGVVTRLLDAKLARRQRFDEAMGERQLVVFAEAYSRAKDIQADVEQADEREGMNNYIRSDCESWFFANRIYLPDRFSNCWVTLRNKRGIAARLREGLSGQQGPLNADRATRLESVCRECSTLAHELTLAILDEMKLQPLAVSTKKTTWLARVFSRFGSGRQKS